MATDRKDSFGARGTLKGPAGGVDYFRLAALAQGRGRRRGPPAVQHPHSAREPSAQRGRAPGARRRTSRPWRAGSRPRRRSREVPYHAGAGAAAGLHRRAGGGRPGGHARRDAPPGRRAEAHQPADSRRPGHRPLRAGRPASAAAAAFRVNGAKEFERNRERYVFLRWGQESLRELPRRAAGDRHLPPGQPRVPGAGGVRARRGRRAAWPSPTPWSAPTRTPP